MISVTHQRIGTKVQDGVAVLLHDCNEDFVCESLSVFDHQIRVMADGHAGSEAPEWFTEGVKSQLTSLLSEKDWSLADNEHQSILTQRATEIFLALDREFVVTKCSKYAEWMLNGSEPSKRPIDDGCTMIANVIRDGYIMNLNLGDSRTVIASLDDAEHYLLFASTDHNMTEKHKIWDIYQRGGRFLNPLR
jgi:serine/threonine protein phosphatase PrpC